jgi:hypothetical protein
MVVVAWWQSQQWLCQTMVVVANMGQQDLSRGCHTSLAAIVRPLDGLCGAAIWSWQPHYGTALRRPPPSLVRWPPDWLLPSWARQPLVATMLAYIFF